MFNLNKGIFGTIAGGDGNYVGSDGGTIAGGDSNYINSRGATVGGGSGNGCGGRYATVPGGGANLAYGDYSFAAGFQAVAFHQGSFVWNDLQGGEFGSTADNQFCIRAGGGVRIAGAVTVENDVFAGGITLNNGTLPGAFYLSDFNGEQIALAYATFSGAFSALLTIR